MGQDKNGQTTMQLNPEESLLLLTCRAYLQQSDESDIRRLVNGAVDWPYVLWRSENFRTTPLLWYHLRRMDLLEAVPEPIRIYLDCWSKLTETRVAALYEQLELIIDVFGDLGIDYYLLKGSALSALYPDPLIRPMLDIDVMIKPDDVSVAREIMYGLGYTHGLWHPETNTITRVNYGPTDLTQHHELPAFLKRIYAKSPVPASLVPETWRRKHIKCFIDENQNASFPLFVDLHLNLSIGFDLEDVWRGTHQTNILNRQVNVQSITGMLWFIAARLYNEAFQFGTLKLIMFGDVHTILYKCADAIDWDELVAVAHQYGMEPALFYVFSQLRSLTKASVPEWVINALRPDQAGIPQMNDWGDVMPKLFSRTILHEVSLA